MEAINQANTEGKLNTLHQLLVTDYPTLKQEFIDLLRRPRDYDYSHTLSLVLPRLKDSDFIEPILEQLNLSDKGDPWLLDYLYAASRLFGQTSEEENFDVPKSLLDKLEDWLLNNTGELSMYTAALIKYYESERAEQIQLKKLEQDDFFMVHWDCLMGLVRINRTKYLGLVRSIAEDETKHKELRKACQSFLDDHRLSGSD